MYYKFKVDIGVKQYAWLIFMIVIILLVASFVGSVFEIATTSEEFGYLFLGIGCLISSVYIVKFFVESIFIIPAREYEKNNIIAEEKREEEKLNGTGKSFLK